MLCIYSTQTAVIYLICQSNKLLNNTVFLKKTLSFFFLLSQGIKANSEFLRSSKIQLDQNNFVTVDKVS